MILYGRFTGLSFIILSKYWMKELLLYNIFSDM